jgi:hypothetical protein
MALWPQQGLPSSGSQQHLPTLVENIEEPVVSFPSQQFIAGLLSLRSWSQPVALVTSLPWQQA